MKYIFIHSLYSSAVLFSPSLFSHLFSDPPCCFLFKSAILSFLFSCYSTLSTSLFCSISIQFVIFLLFFIFCVLYPYYFSPICSCICFLCTTYFGKRFNDSSGSFFCFFFLSFFDSSILFFFLCFLLIVFLFFLFSQFADQIHEPFENDNYTLGVFNDLSKVFDTIEYAILLKNLENYGINGTNLTWFRSHLTNRKQYIQMTNDSKSDFRNATCGVPQGSILGPLLFLVFVNGLASSSKILNPIMFADDANLFYKHKNIIKLFATVN